MSAILVIDDEPSARTFMKHTLKDHFLVYVCEDYDGATKLLTIISFDLILIDVALAESWGSDLVPKIRKGKQQGLIVLFSSLPEENLRKEAQLAMADGYIKKKLDREPLLKDIRRILKKKPASAEELKAAAAAININEETSKIKLPSQEEL
jgi:DNA-binding response OmpR family regulator